MFKRDMTDAEYLLDFIAEVARRGSEFRLSDYSPLLVEKWLFAVQQHVAKKLKGD